MQLVEKRYRGWGERIWARDVWLEGGGERFCRAWIWRGGLWRRLVVEDGPLSRHVRQGDWVKVEWGWIEEGRDIVERVRVYRVEGGERSSEGDGVE